MSHVLIRQRAALCGYVSDAVSGAGIAEANVQIVGTQHHTRAASDGFYYFLNLPEGLYTLTAAASGIPGCYGEITVADVSVASDAVGRPVLDVRGNLALEPTTLSGRVSRSTDGAPLANAQVWLRAVNRKVSTNAQGQYLASAVQAGAQLVQVSRAGFVTLEQRVVLLTGQHTSLDFTLTAS